jgi:hypothetical protein
MRKSVRWTVCPVVGSHPTERIIQSARRIANVDLATGRAVLSDGKGGHQGFHKLQPFAGAKVVNCSQELLDQLNELQPQDAPVRIV